MAENAENLTPETDDIASDVRAAINEAKGGESDTPVKITLDRPRDETGKFTKPEGEQAQQPKPQRPVLTLPEKQLKEGEQAQAAVDPNAPKVLTAPNSWAAPMKEEFSKLPANVQAYIAKREADAHAAITKQDEAVQFGRKAKEIAAPYEPVIAAEGGDTLGMLKNYLNWAYIFRTGTPESKVQALHQVAQMFNVPLGNPVQPALHGSAADIESRQRIERLEQQWQQEIQQRQLQEQAEYRSLIDEFAADPEHDHFETVRNEMGIMLQNGLAKDLEDAYERAVYSNPDIRSSLMQRAQTQAKDQRTQGQQAQVNAARRAAVSITGSPGAANAARGANGSVGSIEDDIRAAMRQVTGRV